VEKGKKVTPITVTELTQKHTTKGGKHTNRQDSRFDPATPHERRFEKQYPGGKGKLSNLMVKRVRGVHGGGQHLKGGVGTKRAKR